MTSEREQIRAARAELKKSHAAVFDGISAPLFEADPIGINFGSNTDEYDPEVGTILPRLPGANTPADVQAIVHEEFRKWFDAEDVGPVARYESIAQRIWELWRQRVDAGQ